LFVLVPLVGFHVDIGLDPPCALPGQLRLFLVRELFESSGKA
jgi:hypothetical protein